jgi:hypothetical protein
MGILTLAFLQLGTTARRCAIGHHPSRSSVSATGGGEVSSTKSRGVEASGARAILQDSTMELKRLHYSLVTVALNNGGCGSF